ncbi:MAG TPA: SDR family oxidoreductase [Solirubrobacteraceae bacterium]|nr:SDR family oxidoreductase [Solirubrobacteraceae bacterium]
MRVAIAGAHGQIAQHLTRLLVARGDSVVGLIRNPDHAADIRALGAEPAICDLEQASAEQVAAAIAGADAAVFAAGAGPGSGAERKLAMDRDGAIRFLDAAVQVGASRFLIVSSVGAESPPTDDDVFSIYLRAKAQADQAVAASDRDWTVVRPGHLTDEPGTGRVRIDVDPFRGEVAREDVAAVLAALLTDSGRSRQTIYLNGGETPIPEALAAAAAT